VDRVGTYRPNLEQGVAKLAVVGDVTVGRVRVSCNYESDPTHGEEAWRLQKPTPPGVSRTSAGQQAPQGSPSDIRDRLPKIDSDSSELAQPAFPTSSQLPRAGRPSSRHGVIAIEGERSCHASRWRDRLATVAIARRGALGVIAGLAAGGVVVRPFSHVRTAGAAPGLRTPDSDQIGPGATDARPASRRKQGAQPACRIGRIPMQRGNV